jgi:hypothetical protein
MSRTTDGRRDRGQGLAEFALILPVLLVLILGIFDIGRLVIAYTAITNAAREGARLAVVNQDVPSIEDRVRNQTIIADPTITVEFRETGPNPDAADNAECDPLEAGCIALVHVETTLDVITPVIGNLVGPLDLTAEAQMPVDFVCPTERIPQWDEPDECPKQP